MPPSGLPPFYRTFRRAVTTAVVQLRSILPPAARTVRVLGRSLASCPNHSTRKRAVLPPGGARRPRPCGRPRRPRWPRRSASCARPDGAPSRSRKRSAATCSFAIAEGKPVVDGSSATRTRVLPAARARAHRRPRRDPPRRARPGEEPHHPLARRPARRVAAGRRRVGDQRRPVPAGVSRTPVSSSPSAGEDTPITWVHRSERYGEKLATPDTSIADLIGEVDPIKVAEGRYLSDELTIHYGLVPRTNRGIFAINELPGPRRAHPGRPARRARGARRPDPRPQGAPPARHPARGLGQPGGLHEPGTDHHAAEGPLRGADPHALPAGPRHRAHDRRTGGPRLRRPRASGSRSPSTCPRSSARVSQLARAQPEGEPALGRVGAPERRQPRDARRRRRPPGAAARRDRGGPTSERPRRLSSPRRSASSRSSRSKKDEDEEVVDKLINAAVLQTFREHCPTETLGQVVGGFDDGKVVHAGPDLSSADYVAHAASELPGTPYACHRAQRGIREPGRDRQRRRARAGRASTCPSGSTRTPQGRGRHTGRDRAATWRTSSTRVGTALRPASTSTRTRSCRRSTTTCCTTATSDRRYAGSCSRDSRTATAGTSRACRSCSSGSVNAGGRNGSSTTSAASTRTSPTSSTRSSIRSVRSWTSSSRRRATRATSGAAR